MPAQASAQVTKRRPPKEVAFFVCDMPCPGASRMAVAACLQREDINVRRIDDAGPRPCAPFAARLALAAALMGAGSFALRAEAAGDAVARSVASAGGVATAAREVVGQARRFHHVNANASLSRDGTRLTTSGDDRVATGLAQAPLRGRAYMEAEIFHGGQYAAGISLWGEPVDALDDAVHPGRSYGRGGASVQAVSAWAVVAYANYGLPGDAVIEMASLSGAPGQRIVVQVAVDAATRSVWVKLATDRGWVGGGDPSAGARPSFVLGGAGPILPGGNVSGPGNHVELRAPAQYLGPVPAGYEPLG